MALTVGMSVGTSLPITHLPTNSTIIARCTGIQGTHVTIAANGQILTLSPGRGSNKGYLTCGGVQVEVFLRSFHGGTAANVAFHAIGNGYKDIKFGKIQK